MDLSILSDEELDALIAQKQAEAAAAPAHTPEVQANVNALDALSDEELDALIAAKQAEAPTPEASTPEAIAEPVIETETPELTPDQVDKALPGFFGGLVGGPDILPVVDHVKQIAGGTVDEVGNVLKSMAASSAAYKTTPDYQPVPDHVFGALDAANPPPETPDRPLKDSPLFQAGQDVNDWIEETIPNNPELFGGGLSRGLGSFVPYAALSALGPQGSVAGGIMGMAGQGGEAIERAENAGVSEEDMRTAHNAAFLIGASEQISADLVLKKLVKVAGKVPKFGKILEPVLETLASGTTEGFQEALQTWSQNVVEFLTYAEDKDLSADVLESGLMGFGVGGIVGGTTEFGRRLKARKKQNAQDALDKENQDKIDRVRTGLSPADARARMAERPDIEINDPIDPNDPQIDPNDPQIDPNIPKGPTTPKGGSLHGGMDLGDTLASDSQSAGNVAGVQDQQPQEKEKVEDDEPFVALGSDEILAMDGDELRAYEERRQAHEAKGSKKKPAKVEKPEDMDSVRAQVDPEPTEKQKAAENYKQGHIQSFKEDGFDLTIETVKDGERKGTDKDGNEWSVKMPYDYGKIKRTEGADGDAVDIGIGDDHETKKAFILDQNDPETGEFDEHKTFVAMSSKEEVLEKYRKSFSDGKDRVASINETTVDGLHDWAKNGDTKTPYADQVKKAATLKDFERDHGFAMRDKVAKAGIDINEYTPEQTNAAVKAHTVNDVPLADAFTKAKADSEKAFETAKGKIAEYIAKNHNSLIPANVAKKLHITEAEADSLLSKQVGAGLLERDKLGTKYKRKAKASTKPVSLLQRIGELGGIDLKKDTGELKAILDGKSTFIGGKHAISNKGQWSLDDMRQKLADEGYPVGVSDTDTDAGGRSDLRAILEAIENEVSGNKQYKADDLAAVQEMDAEAQQAEADDEINSLYEPTEAEFIRKGGSRALVDELRDTDGMKLKDLDPAILETAISRTPPGGSVLDSYIAEEEYLFNQLDEETPEIPSWWKEGHQEYDTETLERLVAESQPDSEEGQDDEGRQPESGPAESNVAESEVKGSREDGPEDGKDSKNAGSKAETGGKIKPAGRQQDPGGMFSEPEPEKKDTRNVANIAKVKAIRQEFVDLGDAGFANSMAAAIKFAERGPEHAFRDEQVEFYQGKLDDRKAQKTKGEEGAEIKQDVSFNERLEAKDAKLFRELTSELAPKPLAKMLLLSERLYQEGVKVLNDAGYRIEDVHNDYKTPSEIVELAKEAGSISGTVIALMRRQRALASGDSRATEEKLNDSKRLLRKDIRNVRRAIRDVTHPKETLAELEAKPRPEDVDELFAYYQAVSDAKDKAASKMANEPMGGIVLVSKDGKKGAAVSRNTIAGTRDGKEVTKEWRASYFDENGFSGHIDGDTREDVLRMVLDENYRDTNRNLLKEFMSDPKFMEGIEANEKAQKEHAAAMKKATEQDQEAEKTPAKDEDAPAQEQAPVRRDDTNPAHKEAIGLVEDGKLDELNIDTFAPETILSAVSYALDYGKRTAKQNPAYIDKLAAKLKEAGFHQPLNKEGFLNLWKEYGAKDNTQQGVSLSLREYKGKISKAERTWATIFAHKQGWLQKKGAFFHASQAGLDFIENNTAEDTKGQEATTEEGADGKEQFVVPGAEKTKAKEKEKMEAKVAQKDSGGLALFGDGHKQDNLFVDAMGKDKLADEPFKSSIPFITDNPGGRWLDEKQAKATKDMAESGPDTLGKAGLHGAVTRSFKSQYVWLDAAEVSKIPGVMGEAPAPGGMKYDPLMEQLKKEKQLDAILIGVNHLGQPFIIEGNNRAAVARDLGIPVKTEVRWFNGGEEATTGFTAEHMETLIRDEPAAPKAEENSDVQEAEVVQPYTMDSWRAASKKLSSGDMNAADVLAAFDENLANLDAIVAELSSKAWTIPKLKRFAGFRTEGKKADLAETVADNFLKHWNVLNRPISFMMGTSYKDALREVIAKQTDADIKEYVDKVAQRKAEKEAAKNGPTEAEMSALNDEIPAYPNMEGIEARGYYISTGEDSKMFTLRVKDGRTDEYLANLSTVYEQAIYKAQLMARDAGRAGVWTEVNEVGEIIRSAPSKPAESSAESDPDPVAEPDLEPVSDEKAEDWQVLIKHGLVVDEASKRKGGTYWRVTGNTKEHKELLDSLGFAKPYKLAGKWQRAHWDGDPTAKLAEALRTGTVPEAAQEAQESETAPKPTIPTDEATKLLAEFKMEVIEADGTFYVTGKGTFANKELIKAIDGRKWDGGRKAWSFKNDPTQELGAALKNYKQEGGTGQTDADNAGTKPNPDEQKRLAKLRAEQDARADDRAGDSIARNTVSAETQGLIRKGAEFGIPDEVLNEQIEDIGLATLAYENEKPMFLLANEAGTGKTFVVGGMIKEMRARGQDKFVYVTQSQDLIAQVKRDLEPYGIGDVEFISYVKVEDADTSGAVLIFDEAHNIKNEASQRGAHGAAKIAAAKMTVLASATPFQNPVEAGYLGATGVFDEMGGFTDWAKAYGAAVRVRDHFDYELGKKVEIETVYWPGRGKKKDLAAARQWFFKQGVMTQRAMKIDPDMVETVFQKHTVQQKWVDLYNKVNEVYDTVESAWRDESGNSRDAKITAEVARHREGVIKRILEGSKIEFAIARAKEIVADGDNVVLFVETKSDRTLGKFRKKALFKDKRLYSPAEMTELMNEWKVQKELAFSHHQKPPPSPFAEFIYEIAMAYDKHGDTGLIHELPSGADEIISALGAENVGVYTGGVTGAKATQAKKDFLAGKIKVLVATMAKGGTGLSLHDVVGDRPTVQVNVNLPWAGWQVAQVMGRVARYGLQSKARIEWHFAENIPWENQKLAPRVGARMSDMGALVQGIEVKAAEQLLGDFEFDGIVDVGQKAGEGVIDVNEEEHDVFHQAAALEKSRRKADNTKGGFFETPLGVAALMGQAAGVTAGSKVLEPSAGTGNLLRFLPQGVQITAVEQRYDNFEKLKGNLSRWRMNDPKPTLENADFLEFEGDNFDAIVMNPPFERLKGLGRQDALHVQRAYDMLAPNGRLISIMGEGVFGGSMKQDVAFRDWLEIVGATVVTMPEKAFKNSGTNVRTRLIVIDKAGDAGRSDLNLTDMEPDSLRAMQDMLPIKPDDGPSFGAFASRVAPEKETTATNTPEFANWFGDSKITDVYGKPLVVYHGSPDGRDIREQGFSTALERYSADSPFAYQRNRTGPYFFTNQHAVAKTYADPYRADDLQAANPEVFPVYLKMENPLVIQAGGTTFGQIKKQRVIDAFGPDHALLDNLYLELAEIRQGRQTEDTLGTGDLARLSRDFGFDGVVINNVIDDYSAKGKPATVYILHNNKNVKSAKENRGTFDPQNASILASKIGDNNAPAGPVFYSHLLDTVKASSQAKAPGAQWLATLLKTPGMKKVELDWTGTTEFLEGKKSVTKEELVEHIEANEIEIEFHTLSDDEDSYNFDFSDMVQREIPDYELQGNVNDIMRDSDSEYAPDFHTREEAEEYVIAGWNEGENWEQQVTVTQEGVGVRQFTVWREEEYWFAQEKDGASVDIGRHMDQAEVQAAITEHFLDDGGNGDRAGYQDWTKPGGLEYREVQVTAPNLDGGKPGSETKYISSHYGEENIVTHFRIKTRIGPNGEKVLWVEEIQSDWATTGREHGYSSREDLLAQEQRRKDADAAKIEYDEKRKELVSKKEKLLLDISNGKATNNDFMTIEPDETTGNGWFLKVHGNIVDSVGQFTDPDGGLSTAGRRMADAHSRERAEELREKIIGDPYGRGEIAHRAWIVDHPDIQEISDREQAFRNERIRHAPTAPETPFEKHWEELALKRIMRLAVDEGYDQIAWTTGDQQNERYNLAKTVEEIVIEPIVKDGSRHSQTHAAARLKIYETNGQATVIFDHTTGEIKRSDDYPEFKGKNLSEVIGAALAEETKKHGEAVARLAFTDANGQQNELRFIDNDKIGELMLEGQAMRTFYDKKIVNIANKIGKKFGARTERFQVVSEPAKLAAENKGGETERTARRLLTEDGRPELIGHKMDITPAMRFGVVDGFTLFKRRENVWNYTDRLGAAVEELGEQFERVIGVHGRLQLIDNFEQYGMDKDLRGSWDSVSKTVLIALGKGNNQRGTLNHEAIHALREAGVFTAQEWAALERMSKAIWMKQFNIRKTYDQFYRDTLDITEAQLQELLIEEGVAHAMEAYTIDPQGQQRSIATKIFEKVAKVLELIRQAFGKQGFHTPNDIFQNVASGEVAARPAGSGVARTWTAPMKDRSTVPPKTATATKPPMAQPAMASLRPPSAPLGPKPANNFYQPPHETTAEAWADKTNSMFGRVKASAGTGIKPTRAVLQDSFLEVKRVEKAAMKHEREAGRSDVLPENEQTYLAERLYAGKQGAALEELQQDVVEPIIKKMKEADLAIDEVADFLSAKHAVERNKAIGRQTYQKGKKKGNFKHKPGSDIFDAVTDPTKVGASGWSENEAKAVLMEATRQGKRQALEEVARDVYAMNKETTRRQYAAGLIDYETYKEHTIGQYKYYVPQRGWETDPDQPRGKNRVSTGSKHSTRGPEFKHAKGRKTKADNPLIYSIMQAQASIVRAERNNVGKTFMRFVERFPNPELYEIVKPSKKPMPIDPRTGLPKQLPDRLAPNKDGVAQFGVKIDGKQHIILVHHEGLARDLGALGSHDIHKILQVGLGLNRFQSAMATAYAVGFIAVNFVRDAGTGFIHLGKHAKKAPGIRRKVYKSLMPAIGGALLAQYSNKSNSVWAQRYKEFNKAGGKTGIMMSLDVEKMRKAHITMMRDLGAAIVSWRSGKKVGKAVMHFVESINTAVENGIRLSTFHHLKEAGYTSDAAAEAARTLTVDFNKKGHWGNELQASFLFINPAIQGSTGMAQHIASSKSIQRSLPVIIAFGFLMDQINRHMSDDDDDEEGFYSKIPNYVKENNTVIMVPEWVTDVPGLTFVDEARKKGAYLKIPQPWGYNIFAYTGQQISEAYEGTKEMSAISIDLALAFSNAFNPLNGDDMSMFIPSVFMPGVELGRNRDRFDRPIMPETANWEKYEKPDAQRYYKSVNPLAKHITDYMSKIGPEPGNEVRPGALDVSPETLEYMTEWLFKGFGKSITKSIKTISDVSEGNELETYNIPVIRRLYGTNSRYVDRDLYYQIREKVSRTVDEYQMFKSQKPSERTVDLAAYKKKRYVEIKMYNTMRFADKKLGWYRKKRKQLMLNKRMNPDSKKAQLEKVDAAMDLEMMKARLKYNRLINLKRKTP